MLRRMLDRLRRILLTKQAYRFFVREWLPADELRRASGVLASLRFSQIITPVLISPPTRRRVVVIAPHPDDESIGPGGTLCLATDNSCNVKIIYLSDGPQGSMRRNEAVKATAALGATSIFMGWTTRNLPVDSSAQLSLAAAIGSNCDCLFLPFLLDDHDDHRRSSELLLATAQAKHLDCSPEIWAYQVYTALPGNVVVDVTQVQERKESIIRLYQTQMATRDWAHFARGRGAVSSRFLAPSPIARFAELFFVVPLEAYLDLCQSYFGTHPELCYLGDTYRARPQK